jgi:hypothetical protein
MQAHAEREGGQEEMVGEVRAKLVTRTFKEITPFVVRMELNGEGLFSGNKINGKHMELR